MNILLYAGIRAGLEIPDFGQTFNDHIAQKKHPRVRASSLSAWHLVKALLEMRSVDPLPRVDFLSGGKPVFQNRTNLHFSLAHSGDLCAAVLCDAPCAVDIEQVRPAVSEKLRARCLSNAEQNAADPDFFTFWTRKECIGKLSGEGIIRRPDKIDTLDAQYAPLLFFTDTLWDDAGHAYRLSAVSLNGRTFEKTRFNPETNA